MNADGGRIDDWISESLTIGDGVFSIVNDSVTQSSIPAHLRFPSSRAGREAEYGRTQRRRGRRGTQRMSGSSSWHGFPTRDACTHACAALPHALPSAGPRRGQRLFDKPLCAWVSGVRH
jgi:hypothetical protein